MAYKHITVNLLQKRNFDNQRDFQSPEEDYNILKSLKVEDFNLQGLSEKVGFSNLVDLVMKYGYLKRVDNGRLRYNDLHSSFEHKGVTHFEANVSKKLDFSNVSLSNEQPVFFLSTWLKANLSLNKEYIDEVFYNDLLKPLQEVISMEEKDYNKLPELLYADFTDIKEVLWNLINLHSNLDFSPEVRDIFNNLVYNDMLPYIHKNGLDSFLLNISPTYFIESDTFSYENIYTRAVMASIVRSLNKDLSTLTKMVIYSYFSTKLDIVGMSAIRESKNSVLNDIAIYIAASFFRTKYYWAGIPLYELMKFFGGGYGDFVILIGYYR